MRKKCMYVGFAAFSAQMEYHCSTDGRRRPEKGWEIQTHRGECCVYCLLAVGWHHTYIV